MRQYQHSFSLHTEGPGFVDLTEPIAAFLRVSAISQGLLTLFCPHTSASLLIQENADPDVLADLATALTRFAPWDGAYRHATEGPDDMPAHIRAMLTQTHLSVPVIEGGLRLGTWQAIYLAEHRARPHQRQVHLHLIGA